MKKILNLMSLLLIICVFALSAMSCVPADSSDTPANDNGDDNVPKPSDVPVNITLSSDSISADNTT